VSVTTNRKGVLGTSVSSQLHLIVDNENLNSESPDMTFEQNSEVGILR
jgi:hypothetical protein